MTWVEGGEVKISLSNNIYTISGTLLCDNNKSYTIYFQGEMPIYTDDEYYGDGGDEGDEGDEGDGSGVGTVNVTDTMNAQMFDLNGRMVGKGFRGIYIQNGKKRIGR